MISIKLGPSGGGSIFTQHYGINGWTLQPMVIPNCRRCIGMFIFWKSVFKDCVAFSITAVHIPPGSPSYARKVKKDIFNKISKAVPSGKPYCIIISGGTIDTPQNKFFYRNSFRHFIRPIRFIYPDIPISICEPTKTTFDTTMFITSEGKFDILRRNYAAQF